MTLQKVSSDDSSCNEITGAFTSLFRFLMSVDEANPNEYEGIQGQGGSSTLTGLVTCNTENNI